jgi:hypothetical protein
VGRPQQPDTTGPRSTAPRIPDRTYAPRAVTAVTPLWRGWSLWLHFLFRFAPRYMPFLAAPLAKMKTIHLGRWSIVRKVPSRDTPGKWQRLPRTNLLFETNFDGPWRPYIEDLGRAMPMQWRGIWNGAIGFPGPLPVSDLLDYIEKHDHRAVHYYSADAHETLQGTLDALELERRLVEFARAVREQPDDAFWGEWQKFLTDVQRLL